MSSFGWVRFASRPAVAAVLERLPAPPAGVLIAAGGKATALTLRQRAWPVELGPDEGNAAALIGAFAARWTPAATGGQVLYPASSRALPPLAPALAPPGAPGTQVHA